MKRWLQNLMYKFNVFMQGRYGYDDFGKCLIITALVLVILSYFPYLKGCSFIAMVVLIYHTYRAFSKNYNARRNELNKYYVVSDKMKQKIRLYKSMWRDRNTHRYFKCKNCGAMIRIPRNKGEIEVTCPRCRARTTKKT